MGKIGLNDDDDDDDDLLSDLPDATETVAHGGQAGLITNI